MNWKKILIVAGLSFLIVLFFAQKIYFINADLGRHIKNGENLLIATNYYSYTEPDYPVINHHWGAGVVFNFIYKLFGFIGLSIFNILLYLISILIFFLIARKLSNFYYALFFTLFALPLIAYRTEIRPEVFSFLLLAIFFYILVFKKPLWILIPLQVLWVNLHIFFIFSFVLAVVFWIKTKNKNYLFLLFGLILASLINPFFIKGLLEPFLIFKDYGYMIAENQPIWFMQKRFPNNITYYHFEFLLLISIISASLSRKKNNIILFFFALAGIFMIRVMPIFALFFVPIVAGNLYYKWKKINLKWASAILSFVLILSINSSGFGLAPKVNASADFYKNNNIQGPVFNNYDIGGYLIFHDIKVFIDNRPEAYSINFLDDYKLMQEHEEKWIEIDNKYNFNSIYFYRLDYTEHAQPFLIKRLKDPDWAPIFVDDYALLLLKRNHINKEIINNHELDKSIFKYVKT